MGDYVGNMTPQAKKGKNRPNRAGLAKGGNVKVKFGLFFIVCPMQYIAWDRI